jgi:hypothetical protein
MVEVHGILYVIPPHNSNCNNGLIKLSQQKSVCYMPAMNLTTLFSSKILSLYTHWCYDSKQKFHVKEVGKLMRRDCIQNIQFIGQSLKYI